MVIGVEKQKMEGVSNKLIKIGITTILNYRLPKSLADCSHARSVSKKLK